MVAGIEKFRQFFKDYPDHYAIIGGAACDILFDVAGLPFRATKDIDMVLCIEVVDAGFGEKLSDFLNAGGYEAREQSSGRREFFAFTNLKTKTSPSCWSCSQKRQRQSLLAMSSSLSLLR